MRCLACNKELTDFEATRKGAYSKQFIDLCNSCYSTISNEINAIERDDLATEVEMELDVNEEDLQ